jgi:hypothetical protein
MELASFMNVLIPGAPQVSMIPIWLFQLKVGVSAGKCDRWYFLSYGEKKENQRVMVK